jgi:hypothetical protein
MTDGANKTRATEAATRTTESSSVERGYVPPPMKGYIAPPAPVVAVDAPSPAPPAPELPAPEPAPPPPSPPPAASEGTGE